MRTYEQKLDELKSLNDQLMNAELPLAQAVALYEKAQLLMTELKEELEKAKLIVDGLGESRVQEVREK